VLKGLLSVVPWSAKICEHLKIQGELPVKEDTVILLGAGSHSSIGELFQDNSLSFRSVRLRA